MPLRVERGQHPARTQQPVGPASRRGGVRKCFQHVPQAHHVVAPAPGAQTCRKSPWGARQAQFLPHVTRGSGGHLQASAARPRSRAAARKGPYAQPTSSSRGASDLPYPVHPPSQACRATHRGGSRRAQRSRPRLLDGGKNPPGRCVRTAGGILEEIALPVGHGPEAEVRQVEHPAGAAAEIGAAGEAGTAGFGSSRTPGRRSSRLEAAPAELRRRHPSSSSASRARSCPAPAAAGKAPGPPGVRRRRRSGRITPISAAGLRASRR